MENQNNHVQIIEALLFASDSPLSSDKIQAVLKDITLDEIDTVINSLNEKYRMGEHSFAIKKIAGGYRMYTLPDFAPWIRALFSHNRREKLSQQSLEVLAIVAYKQPIVKSDINRLRGVNSEGPIFTLLDRKLITIVGRKPSPGRPLLYGTTQEFLTHFGLKDLDDLPRIEELEMLLKQKEQAGLTEVMFEKVGEDEVKEREKVTEEEKTIEEVPLPTIPKNPPQSPVEDETQ
ncbi:MAG: SMC-Scp complex subunit ScpB [candidate division Zixibacteria bacterium]|nr:SMC-Scp complex subunit ScpB [candidate division Zixibacteria bacterium]